MNLAKPRMDVGLFTADLVPTLAFWREEIGATPDHLLKIRRGQDQHRHDLRGSVLKINHGTEPLPAAPASGYHQLLVAGGGAGMGLPRVDPTGAGVMLVAPGDEGVTQIGMRILVRDLETHRRFYGQALGLPEESRGRFRAGESLILLEESPAALFDSPVRGPGWRYITFQVFKVDDEYAGAVERGAWAATAPVTLGETARIAMIKDPDGNCIELSQRASIVGTLT